MKKSVLLLGKKGSGKTFRLDELLLMADANGLRTTQMRFTDFQVLNKTELKTQFDLIAIDRVGVSDIDYLSMAIRAFGFILIVASEKSIKELETVDLSVFDVVECSYSEGVYSYTCA